MSRKTRKLIWSAPLVAVLAVAGALAMFVALEPSGAQADHEELPGVVTNLDAEADGSRSIDVIWDAPSAGTVDGYRIDRSEDGNVWVSHQAAHMGTSYKDTGLTAGSTYYYRVFAVNSAGTGPVSTDVLAQTDYPENPSAVRGLTARDTDQNTIVLNWMAPSDDGGSDIAKYRIVVADNDGDSDIPANLPADATAAAAVPIGDGAIVTKDATTTHTHEDLIAGIRYRYQVYAINEATLMSQNAGDTVAETTETLDKPGAPTGLTAVQTATRTYTLYWYAPSQTGGTDISGYKVEVALQGGSFDVPESGLTLEDDDSDTAQATYLVPPTVDHDGNVATPQIPVTTVRFRVYSETMDETKDPDVTLTSTNPDTSRTLTLLADEVTDPSTSATVTLRTKRIPGMPNFQETDPPTDAKRDGFGNVDLDWDAPTTGTATTPSTVSGYRIDVSDNGISWRPLPNASNTRKTDTEYTYKDPEKKNRHYRIFAWNGQYLGPAQMAPVESQPEVADLGVPNHATGLTVTAVGPSQINVSWTAPANTGGSPIMHYEVHGSLMGTAGFAAFPTAATTDAGMLFTTRESTSYSHTGLSAGQTWRYRVVPMNENADNNKAADADAEVRQATTHQEEKPVAPEMLVAESAKTSNSDASEELGVLLLWNAPNAPDGADIGGYRVQRMKDGGAWETLASNTNSTHTDFTDSEEPAMNEMRGYQVAAISANNILGAYSNVAMIPQDTSHTPVVGPEVGPATGVRTGPFNEGGVIQVNWDAAPNATGYIIYAVNVDELDDPDGQIVVEPVNDAAAETINLGGLNVGDTYDIYVVATAKEMVAWPAAAAVQVTAN